jgi:hypothetical protein
LSAVSTGTQRGQAADVAELLRSIDGRLLRIEKELGIRARGVRAGTEPFVITAIAGAPLGSTFMAASVIALALQWQPLHDALTNAFLDMPNPKQLGKLLARLQDITVDGARIELVSDSTGTAVYRVARL